MSMTAQEQWLDANTVRCPVGRISRDDCKRLAARLPVAEALKSYGGRPGAPYPLARPAHCHACEGWQFWSTHPFDRQQHEKQIASRGGAEAQRKTKDKVKSLLSVSASQREKTTLEDIMTDNISEVKPKTKHCNGCGRTLPITEFYETLHNKSGLRPQCKECERARTRRRSAAIKAAKQSGATQPCAQPPTQPVSSRRDAETQGKILGEPALVTLSPGVSPGAPPEAQPPRRTDNLTSLVPPPRRGDNRGEQPQPPPVGRLFKLPPRPYAETAAQDEAMTKIMSLLRDFRAEAYEQGLMAGHRLALEKIRSTLELEETAVSRRGAEAQSEPEDNSTSFLSVSASQREKTTENGGAL